MGIYCFPPEFPSLGQGAFVPHIAAITSCTFPVFCIVLYLTCTLYCTVPYMYPVILGYREATVQCSVLYLLCSPILING